MVTLLQLPLQGHLKCLATLVKELTMLTFEHASCANTCYCCLSGKMLQIVLLDTRYHRDPVGSDGTILGDSQWSWLERELKGPPTAITIIGSSIQVQYLVVNCYDF